MKRFTQENALWITWGIAVLSFLISLYFSEVLKFAPCVLCWYQRIAMYPIVLIVTVAIIRKTNDCWTYVLPLSIIGGGIALYQNLLYYNIIPENFTPCTFGVSCTTRYIDWFGFVSIPLLSLLAFIAITIVMWLYKKHVQQ